MSLFQRRYFYCAVFAFIAAWTAELFGAAPARRPNIVYIMADDLGYGDIGPFGQQQIRTPNLDRMAEEGTCFMQFYPGAAVCAPTRSTLMTGQHTGHTRVRGNHGEAGLNRVPLRPEDLTVAEMLQKAGYATGMAGKWGLGEPGTTGVPNRKGFDFWTGYLNQDLAENYFPETIWRNEREIAVPENAGGRRGRYSNDLFTDEALAFMETNRARPFFLYLAYTVPHLLLEVPADSLAEYAGKFPEPPRNPDKKRITTDQPRATYAAMVTRLDREVGRVFAKLKELGLDRDTVVFFCSDNGANKNTGTSEFFRSHGPFREAKGSLHEGGIHTAMIVRWPDRVPAGRRSEFVWAGWDFFPTAAELAGVPPPPHLDGISVVSALQGQPMQRRGHLYWEVPGRTLAQAVRVGDLKALRADRSQPIEVYNLALDPGETRNIAAESPAFVAQAEELFRTSRTPSEDWPAEAGGGGRTSDGGRNKKAKP
jgi:arylsulfatase A